MNPGTSSVKETVREEGPIEDIAAPHTVSDKQTLSPFDRNHTLITWKSASFALSPESPLHVIRIHRQALPKSMCV